MALTRSLSQRYDLALHALSDVGQEHVLKFYDGLDEHGQDKLLAQIEAQPWKELAEVVDTHVKREPQLQLPRSIEPVSYFPAAPIDDALKARYAEARKVGEQLVRDGKVATFTVAGGQGTRLGWDAPKGTFPCTPITGKSLFQVFAETIRASEIKYHTTIPWLIMTSPLNDEPTRKFFQDNNHFGLSPDSVIFFPQGTVPSFSTDGKALLAERDEIAANPDGHGGALRALHTSGALRTLADRGIEQISYWQVDNPLIKCIDPLFIGLHAIADGQMSSKTVTKAGPLEKVGNFCVGDGVMQVIEYSDLPEELARKTNPDGSLMFNAGSIAIHALRVSFIERLNAGGKLKLPWHRAEKKVPYVDASGNLVKPEKPNAVKLEQFVFDAIPLAKNAIVYTTDRAEEFSPVKNAEGSDSPVTSRRDQTRRAARWLRSAGVAVPMKGDEPDCVIEISPLYASSEAELVAKRPSLKIDPGASVYLG
jgi:UDP-N-acetylglucosamine/UDP-N-acetylgalactosamine diphosphorylase